MLSMIIGLAVGYFLLGGIVSRLVSQVLTQAQGALGNGAAAPVEEEAPTEEEPMEEEMPMEGEEEYEEEPMEEEYEEEY